MKKFLLTLTAILSISTVTFAGNVNVQLNGETINFTDSNGQRVDAQIINSRTMVPLRKIFELLGATVDWDDATQTAYATKDDISIKLQIDNPIAEVTENGVTRKVTLDSKPVLINWRTLVPLRFISESLGKQVAWDEANQTAIIIDYDYFLNKINQKSPSLYKAIIKQSPTSTIQITRNYYDLANSAYNTSSNVYATISQSASNKQNIRVDFSGTSELFKEIVSEGWNSINLDVIYDDNGITYSTTSPILNQMLTGKSNTYKELELTGKYNDSLGEMIKSLLNLNENAINIATFTNIKNEYDAFLNSFTYSNNASTSTIKLNSTKALVAGKYIDITDFDNVIFNNEFAMVYNIVNKLIFNYDIKNDELIYDYPKINATMNISENGGTIVSSISVELINDYNEKVVYNVKITK